MSDNHPCDRLFNDILEAFERVARGAPPNCAAPVIDVLLSYGLVRRTVRVIDRDSLGPIVRHGFSLISSSMPHPVTPPRADSPRRVPAPCE